ncbi:ATP-binding response regulator [Thermomonas flagellata]|uniref:ATP-binding response regulator n=1 Tax=Thermomonas flagellata TaxID=2888524 RepID=UPI001F0478F7|nr:hybrid sensor histidine kinase/response regulator [Thermomonas flagellata]
MLRPLVLRLVLPLAVVVLALFALLAWQTLTLQPAGPARNAELARIALFLGAGLLLVLASGLVIVQRATRPLQQLVAAIERLGRGEEVRLPLDRAPLLRRLQQGVNQASQALADSRNRMASELGRALLELEDRNARLQAAQQARARFLAAASHDLRQPLYALTLFSSTLRAGETDPARLAQVRRVEECVAALDQMFGELLDLSRLEAGALQPQLTNLPLDEVFAEVSRTFRAVAEERGLRLSVRKTDAWVRCDRTMLARMLNNLVSNALRYTDAGGVLVGARARGARVRIDVWDTGRGIAPEHQQQVFEEFYRVAAPVAGGEQARGLGLGLATVRRLAALVDGRLRLASRLGRGTCISLELPAAAAGTAGPDAGDAALPLDVSGLRVLVVDDDPHILEGLRLLLRDWGCHTATADDEAGALAALQAWERPPDLAICDLRLREGRSGIDVLRAVARHYRQDPARPRFARLLVTGETRPDRLAEIAAQRIPVLFKPVSPQKLREAMLASLLVHRPPPR